MESVMTRARIVSDAPVVTAGIIIEFIAFGILAFAYRSKWNQKWHRRMRLDILLYIVVLAIRLPFAYYLYRIMHHIDDETFCNHSIKARVVLWGLQNILKHCGYYMLLLGDHHENGYMEYC